MKIETKVTTLNVKPQVTDLLSNLQTTADKGIKINLAVDTQELIGLLPVVINRAYRRRIAKMLKHFKKPIRSQNIFTVFHVTKTFQYTSFDETITVTPGYYIADGNTRLESMRLNKIPTPEKVICFVYEISSATDFENEYYAIDNQASSENSTDLITGAMSALDVQVDSLKAKSGQFASAIKYAYPGDTKDSMRDKIGYFKQPIQLLDRLGMFKPNESAVCNQHLLGALFVAAKLYDKPSDSKSKFEHIVKSLATLEDENLKVEKGKFNGVTAIIKQICNPVRYGYVNPEYMGSTKVLSAEPCYDFYLHCIEMAMTGKLKNKDRGFKPKHWANTYNDTLDYLQRSM